VSDFGKRPKCRETLTRATTAATCLASMLAHSKVMKRGMVLHACRQWQRAVLTGILGTSLFTRRVCVRVVGPRFTRRFLQPARPPTHAVNRLLTLHRHKKKTQGVAGHGTAQEEIGMSSLARGDVMAGNSSRQKGLGRGRASVATVVGGWPAHVSFALIIASLDSTSISAQRQQMSVDLKARRCLDVGWLEPRLPWMRQHDQQTPARVANKQSRVLKKKRAKGKEPPSPVLRQAAAQHTKLRKAPGTQCVSSRSLSHVRSCYVLTGDVSQHSRRCPANTDRPSVGNTQSKASFRLQPDAGARRTRTNNKLTTPHNASQLQGARAAGQRAAAR